MGVWANVPEDTEPRRNPAKDSFSAVYSQNGICGALGLPDQGGPEGSDMIQVSEVYSLERGLPVGEG